MKYYTIQLYIPRLTTLPSVFSRNKKYHKKNLKKKIRESKSSLSTLLERHAETKTETKNKNQQKIMDSEPAISPTTNNMEVDNHPEETLQSNGALNNGNSVGTFNNLKIYHAQKGPVVKGKITGDVNLLYFYNEKKLYNKYWPGLRGART